MSRELQAIWDTVARYNPLMSQS